MMTCRKALLFPPQNQQARKHHYNHAKASQICIPQQQNMYLRNQIVNERYTWHMYGSIRMIHQRSLTVINRHFEA